MKLNVVLYHPEIPQNTGNIMRSCVGFHAKLHLIKPLGFSLDEKKLKRSCVDYFDYLDYEVYENFDDFSNKNKGKYYFFTRYGHQSPIHINFKDVKEDIYLIFGAESTGIAYDILKEHLDDCYRFPTTNKVRSLNLSNCAAIGLFLASSQLEDSEILKDEPECFKGANFLEELDVNELTSVHKEH
ncbi:MAG: tRNA (cytidine(34)-2'-O)-methyltransferase [Anaeroplasmataceae bacterium]|nr:tRNA (cytidine(34)-2'-O)-methyltransferase [Anaeroplasmataceae bacterium]MDE5868013.1 tRNA (cytidine(34)-2'-O)-methyltransferase [Anaeroplasmataceae bacterium]